MRRAAILLVLLVACVSHTGAEATARRYAEHVPGATGVECGSDACSSEQYCTVFREHALPVSLRCDDDVCTGMPKPDETTLILTGGGGS